MNTITGTHLLMGFESMDNIYIFLAYLLPIVAIVAAVAIVGIFYYYTNDDSEDNEEWINDID